MKKIKALMYGVGVVAQTGMVRLMVEKGVDVVGAVSRSSNIGKDLGEVCGTEHPLGVKISNDPEEVISNHDIDIAVHAVTNSIADSYDQIARCVSNGINVITIGTEAFYPWNTSPVIASKLDKLAKENSVTIAGSGYQDFYWANMITQLAGTCHQIESISGTAGFNINDYGAEVVKSYFVGDSVDEFNAKIEKHGLPSNAMRYCAELICADMELTIIDVVESCEPIIGDADMYIKSSAATVPAGKLIGCTSMCEIESEQGIKIRIHYTRTCYKKGQHDINKWAIHGHPNTNIEVTDPPTSISTSSTTVNRIPDVINAEPGFFTCEKLPKLRYRTYPLHYYLKPA